MSQADLQRSLIKTIEKNYPERMLALLDEGARANEADQWGSTPLMEAVFSGDPHIVSLLLDRGARVDAADRNGMTALHRAFRYDAPANPLCLRMMVERGADVNARDEEGKTPLWTALHMSFKGGEDNTASIHALLDLGADVLIADNEGMTPLALWREVRPLSGPLDPAVGERMEAMVSSLQMEQGTAQSPIVSKSGLRF